MKPVWIICGLLVLGWPARVRAQERDGLAAESPDSSLRRGEAKQEGTGPRNPSPAREASKPGRRRTVLLVVARSRPLDGLRQALASQLVSTGARLRIETVAALPKTMGARFARVLAAGTDPDLVLVAWCEPMDGTGDVLAVVDAGHGRMLLRPVKDCATTEGAEEAALIVRTAVDVLLSGGSVGVALPRAAAKPRPRSAPRPEPRRHRSSARESREIPDLEEPSGATSRGSAPPVKLAATLAFRLDSLSTELPANPGGGVGFAVRLIGSWFWFIDLWMASPANRSNNVVSVELWRYLFETGIFYRWTRGAWKFSVQGSLFGEWRRLETQGAAGVVLGAITRNEGLLGASGRGRVSVRLTDALRLYLFAGFQVTIWGPVEYWVILPDGSRRNVFQWWPVQPISGLGLEVRLL